MTEREERRNEMKKKKIDLWADTRPQRAEEDRREKYTEEKIGQLV